MRTDLLAAVAALALVSGCSSGGGAGPGPGPGPNDPPSPGWGASAQVGLTRDANTVDIFGVDVALNAAGVGIATWEEDADTTGSVWIAWYRGGAWEAPVRLSDPSAHGLLPRVALNDAGDAVVAFEVVEHDGAAIASRTVWARRYTGGAWLDAERLCAAPPAPSVLYASRPRVGLDASGKALVVWYQQQSGAAFTIHASRFDGSTWSAPFAVSGGVTNALWPDAAVSAGGRAAVVWVQDTNPYDPNRSGGGPSNPSVRARVLSGDAWADPQVLNTTLADFEGTERPSVVMDAAGRAFAIWEEHRAVNRVVAATLDVGAVPTWSAPSVLGSSPSPSTYLSFPDIATDGNGAALAAWQRDDPDTLLRCGAAARLDAGSGTWSAPFDFDTSAPVASVAVAMDGAGTGWSLSSTSTGWLRARRQAADGTWDAAKVIGTGTLRDAEANAAGAVLVGSQVLWTAMSTPFFRLAPQGTVFVP